MSKQIAATALIVTLATLTTASLLPLRTWPQTAFKMPIKLERAENLARQAAETANGGIEHYRAENSMYGPAEQSPHKYDGHGTWTFDFTGHAPGSDTPSVESVVTVSQTGMVQINYNGPVRSVPK